MPFIFLCLHSLETGSLLYPGFISILEVQGVSDFPSTKGRHYPPQHISFSPRHSAMCCVCDFSCFCDLRETTSKGQGFLLVHSPSRQRRHSGVLGSGRLLAHTGQQGSRVWPNSSALQQGVLSKGTTSPPSPPPTSAISWGTECASMGDIQTRAYGNTQGMSVAPLCFIVHQGRLNCPLLSQHHSLNDNCFT